MKCTNEGCDYEGSVGGQQSWTCDPKNPQPFCPKLKEKPESEFQKGGNTKPATKGNMKGKSVDTM